MKDNSLVVVLIVVLLLGFAGVGYLIYRASQPQTQTAGSLIGGLFDSLFPGGLGSVIGPTAGTVLTV